MKKLISFICVLAVLAGTMCIGVTAANPAVAFRLEAEHVNVGDTTMDVNLIVTLPDGATGYELGSFCVEMNYDPSVMQLSKGPTWQVKGTTCSSENVSVLPYMLLWISIKPAEQYKPGDNIAATMTFNLTKSVAVGDTYSIDLDVNDDNGVCSMASSDGSYTMTSYDISEIEVSGLNITMEKPTIKHGDANEDGNINIADVSLMLKHIAKWEGLTINTDASDANADGNVNITDVSLLLKHIAKWDGVVLGPQ